MKTTKLSGLGEAAFDRLCATAGDAERRSLFSLLESLPKSQHAVIEKAAAAWAMTCLEKGFVAGAKAGGAGVDRLVNA